MSELPSPYSLIAMVVRSYLAWKLSEVRVWWVRVQLWWLTGQWVKL